MKLHLIPPYKEFFKTNSLSPVIEKMGLFSKMMRELGYETVEYGKNGENCEASKFVRVPFADNDRYVEDSLMVEIARRIEKEDIICHFSEVKFKKITDVFHRHHQVEIGGRGLSFAENTFRIFENYSWMNYCQGQEGRSGKNYEWVIPNFYDLDKWNPSYIEGNYLACLGWLISFDDLTTLLTIADYLKEPIIVSGYEGPCSQNHPNIIFREHVYGGNKRNFLKNAKALIVPSPNSEPLCDQSVEAMLCGTPVIGVGYGSTAEVVQEGMGFKCHTLQDWLQAIHQIGKLDRKFISDSARSKHSLESCGLKYDKVFKQINDLHRGGWYEVSYFNYRNIEIEEKPFSLRLAKWVKDKLNPKNAIDVGCGPGMFVDALRENGIDAVGVDINPDIAYRDYVLQKSIFDVGEKFDFVLCLEVAEHIPEEEALIFLKATLERVEDGGTLVWSAACPGQGGVGHINCQPKEYWVEKIKEQGFNRQVELEGKMISDMAAGYHMGWFLQNAMLCKKS